MSERRKKASRVPNILLIDDERDDLFVLEKFLTREGFLVKSFSNPRELAEEILSVMPGVKREHLIRKPVEQGVFIELVKKIIREPS